MEVPAPRKRWLQLKPPKFVAVRIQIHSLETPSKIRPRARATWKYPDGSGRIWITTVSSVEIQIYYKDPNPTALAQLRSCLARTQDTVWIQQPDRDPGTITPELKAQALKPPNSSNKIVLGKTKAFGTRGGVRAGSTPDCQQDASRKCRSPDVILSVRNKNQHQASSKEPSLLLLRASALGN